MHFTCENTLIADFLEFRKNLHLPPSLPPGKNLPILLKKPNLKFKENSLEIKNGLFIYFYTENYNFTFKSPH